MSKALNELKKATMASYLSKAGGRVRSGTKIGLDFQNDAYKDMAIANKHHPNMVTPGFEKDPEKLKSAEARMSVNMDLANTFKRDAANRIKGIARAGRRLAKEDAEEVNEVSRSTIAKVATARYQQAQKALKDKNYGGYVKSMKKAIKAADSTTPNTGWSPEDDKKNEEVVPVISAQEKYRQIKEAKIRARKGK